jgi:N-acetylglutamate synthase-like GNAT family acetyltransferase
VGFFVPDTIDIFIRPAQQSDEANIKAMIRREQLDPTSLKWSNFLVAECNGEIVGIGQIKRYPGCNELGSLVTLPEYRNKGIASRLIAELEAQAGFPLYLLCASGLESYYQRFGYQRISWWDAPRFLKLKVAPTILFRLFGIRILVMKKHQ